MYTILKASQWVAGTTVVQDLVLVALNCFYVHSPCYKSTSFVPGPSLPLSPAAGECLPVLPSLFSCQTSTPKMHVHFFRGASVNLTFVTMWRLDKVFQYVECIINPAAVRMGHPANQ